MDLNLNKLYSENRIGKFNDASGKDIRTNFQKDFDRIIFSSAFRRLQNKTQVFPLPGSVFVHNRLTHSLEVASVGRSLGTSVGDYIANKYKADLNETSIEFYKYSLYNVIASACLCHDIGNPAFGHSGEDAISSYFRNNEEALKKHFTVKEWSDFINFEGNANAVRIITQQQNGKSEGGLMLTYSTITAIAKYPCESIAIDDNKKIIYRKKFGYFQSEKSKFADIAKETQMVVDCEEPMIFRRHPFVWLVEAADDICYNIIDLEDAHRLNIIEHNECRELLLNLIESAAIDKIEKVRDNLNKIKDRNDQISYLRAKSIHGLTMRSVDIYKNEFDKILSGELENSFFDIMTGDISALEKIIDFSYEKIYNHRAVVEIENAGYNVMNKLLSHFIPPVLIDRENRTKSQKKAISLIPNQFLYETEPLYNRVMGVLDYVSGMTDNYATDLYRKIQGIDIGMTI